MYVNAQLEAQLAVAITIPYDSTVPFAIGSLYSYYRSIGYPRTFNGVIDQVKFYKRALSDSDILFLAQTSSSSGFTPTGTDVAVQPLDSTTGTAPATITFSSVSQAGETTITSTTTAPEPPSGFKTGEPAIYYDISSTSSHSGTITLCFSWTQGQFGDDANEANIEVMHYEGGLWKQVTIAGSRDTTANRICGETTSLSPFALFERHYNFAGFFQPVDNPPTRNSAKAGAAIPVKFSLGGNMGLAVFNSGYPASQSVTCNSSAPISAIEQTVSAGGSSLSYDVASGQYTYIWKSDKTWANSCRRFILNFNDGTSKTAEFSFTK